MKALILVLALSACGDDDPNRRILPDAAIAADASYDATPPPKPDAYVPPWPSGTYALSYDYTGTCAGGATWGPKWDHMRATVLDNYASLTFETNGVKTPSSGTYDPAQDLMRVSQTVVQSVDNLCVVLVKPWTAVHSVRGLYGQIELSFVGNCGAELCHAGTFLSWTITGTREP